MRVKIKEIFYISNMLSISRVILVIPMAYLVYLNNPDHNLLLIFLALLVSATDALDGFISRKFNQVTELGIILDPICDKIAMAIIFAALLLFRDFPVPLLAFFLYRDLVIFISGTALIRVTGNPMMASFWGKANTLIFTLIAIVYILNIYNLLTTLLIGVGYLTLIISTFVYGTAGLRLITESNRVRLAVWTAVLLPTLPIFYVLRHYAYF